ncbi:MAG: tRNA (guanosine(37)-N1)-methyltransferase TrmD [Defluviitaleaceae bacterium]|nr:tRNA (guanosine(37)-N1)-methyltransferase TrmD [Defluviitaleaceae bacterium]
MIFHVLTLFPEVFKAGIHSIIKRGVDNGKIAINIVNIRDFATNSRGQTDGYPFGGGAGMVMMAQPIYDAHKSLNAGSARVAYLSPQGRVFNQQFAAELASETELVLLCGHYEGIDQRVIDEIVTDEISLGNFVMTGGEIAALAIIDAVGRLVPDVIKPESLKDESFSDGLLEYPQFTRPRTFMGRDVPDILLSGNHGEIEKWRRKQALEVTRRKRPDLLGGYEHG